MQQELVDGMISAAVWSQGCPVPIDRLAAVQISYVDFEGAVHDDGEIVVFDAVAPRVSAIFARLLEIGFPIARIRSLHHYGGSDEKSMADNNSSSFNFRPIAGTTTVSMHGYGLAIDVNPLQNPYVVFDEEAGIATIHPGEGWSFLNRRNQKPGMIEPVINVFEENGFFVWGGQWTTPIDYHHFQPPRLVADLLVLMDTEEGLRFFEHCASRHQLLAEKYKDLNATELVAIYRENRRDFLGRFDLLLERA